MSVDLRNLRDFYASETLGSPENAVGFVLWRVVHRFQREVDRALLSLNLTHLQFTTLAMAGWLCRTGASVTQAELSRRADIHAMQVSLMLKALEEKDMVVRPRPATDTRTKLIEITTLGVETLRAAMPIVIAIQRQMFGDAGAPGGELLAQLRAVEADDQSPAAGACR